VPPPKKRATRKTSEPRYFSTQVSEAQRFYLDLNPRAGEPLSIISGGWELCRGDYQIKRNGFPHLIIEFVARGSGSVVLKGKRHDLIPGSTFVYGPRIPVEITATPEHSMAKYFVVFEGYEARGLLKECLFQPGTFLQVSHPEQLQLIFEDLIKHGRGDRANRGGMCRVALQYLTMKIADLAVPHEQSASAAFETYQRCRQLIEQNYMTMHSLREVAAACHVDRAYLCRLFQRFGRQSPFQYLQRLKMNRAVDLLQNSKYLVRETAEYLGFGDPYNFSRAFKRVFGVSPNHLGTC